jgi:alkylated DNA nucleotide flippase Atl1
MNALFSTVEPDFVGAPLGAKDGQLDNVGIAARAAPTVGWRSVILRALITATMLLVFGNAHAQVTEEVLHGADGIFVSPDAAIVWAVLKQPTGDRATVWLRIVNSTRKFSHVAIDGVDPFSKKRERVEAGTRLEAEARIASDRDTFSDLPSREVHLYRTEADLRGNKPALTVYYLGVPDTTPEFSTRAAMDEYLNTARLMLHKVEARP